MPFRWNPQEHLSLGAYVVKWLILGMPTGFIIGSAVALFLWALDWATQTRFNFPWLLFLLPVAGIGVGGLYHLVGKSVEAGNNLIVDQIHEPGGGVPARMAPLVLIGTVITHLFGGSAGREGTAVQMGGSIASKIGQILHMKESDMRILLMCGVAGGFGSVFGTPLTGAIFALEILAIGQMSYEAIIPCLIASIIGNATTRAWGIHHTQYHLAALGRMNLLRAMPPMSWLILGKVAIAAMAFGLASVLFAELAHGLHRIYKWIIPWPSFRPALGGLLVIGLVYALGTRDYLGLGVTADPHHPNAVCILSSFHEGGATWFSWWWKILFTAVTLSSGFKGGEVTPLFFIGAALGNTMARLLHAPVDLFAALGFVAVFAGATNTPFACTIMGVELFMTGQNELLGSGFVIYLAVACFLSYLFSGHTGIYLSQRIGTPKIESSTLPPNASLRDARELQPSLGEVGSFNLSLNCSLFNSSIKESSAWDDQEEPSDNGDDEMPHRHKVSSREIGQIRIYMTPREKRRGGGLRRSMFGKPLYQEVIDAAKADGIMNATAHHTHYGYSGNGKIQHNNHEVPNSNLNLCVELVAHRDELEHFCKKHGDLLKGKVVVYKHMEHWDIHEHSVKHEEVSQEELDVDVEADVTDAK